MFSLPSISVRLVATINSQMASPKTKIAVHARVPTAAGAI
jgi:hypothetical protein